MKLEDHLTQIEKRCVELVRMGERQLAKYASGELRLRDIKKLLNATIITADFCQSWAKEAVDWAKETGLMVGFPDGTFRGREPLTREQGAAIAKKLHDLFYI